MALFTRRRERGLWAYNVRILLGSSLWLIVAPIALTQIVFVWNLATVELTDAAAGARVIEVLAPILAAMLCAYAVAPEQAGVGELVFVRPISRERLLLIRLTIVFLFVLVLLLPPLAIYWWLVPDFPLGTTVLAALVSTLFLSALAMAVASAARVPLVGLAVAGAFWAVDLGLGTIISPVFTLHGYADSLNQTPLSDLWPWGKLSLLVLAAVLYLWNRRQLGQPAARRRSVAAVRAAVVVVVVLLAYLYGGAASKVVYGVQHEAEFGNQAASWYRQAFTVYGPLPAPWLFGRVFPAYLMAVPGRSIVPRPSDEMAAREAVRQKALVAKYPRSMWADNIIYELARTHREETPRALTLLTLDPQSGPTTQVVEGDGQARAAALARFADAYPNSPFAPWARVQQAAIEVAELDFPDAVQEYERVLVQYPATAQAAEAGMTLQALYLRQGRLQEALHAALTAAKTARWEYQGTVYLRAAQLADTLGDRGVARDCYQQAYDTAWTARWRSGAKARGASKLMPSQIIRTAEHILTTSKRALHGASYPLPPAPRNRGAVVGRVLRHGQGLPGVRVALFQSADAQGLGSPFFAQASAQATTTADGSFRLEDLPYGSYPLLALAVPGWHQGESLAGVTVPITVSVPVTPLAPLSLVARVAPPPPAALQAPPPTRRVAPARPGSRRVGPGLTGGRSPRGGIRAR